MKVCGAGEGHEGLTVCEGVWHGRRDVPQSQSADRGVLSEKEQRRAVVQGDVSKWVLVCGWMWVWVCGVLRADMTFTFD